MCDNTGIMRIGIFGGTFNPVHAEHVETAKRALKELNLDKLFIMPTFSSPHKTLMAASAEDRINMLKIAFAGVPEAEISTYETARRVVFDNRRRYVKRFQNVEKSRNNRRRVYALRFRERGLFYRLSERRRIF